MTEDPFTRALGNRRGSKDARVAPSPSPPIIRARALVEQLTQRADSGAQTLADSPVAEVQELAEAHSLSFQLLATRAYAEGAVIVFELWDAREPVERDWSVLLVWRAAGTWGLYTPDVGAIG